ncbi:uncharacterized protein LOC107615882 [Arachis ipaensis]|uniref:uncharacterized protein LOC107615882 n=1 Tax=Arachis ipaensis TaxID=130454 RepID=UPI0007AF5B33|nr:uncharacterized protein LOC107615882 [Arachis ipaensis]
METHGRGRGWRGNEEPTPTGNQAGFLAVMTQLINTMQANVAAVNQATGRMNEIVIELEEVQLQAVERAMQVQHVPEDQLVEFTAYQLRGEAQHWWQGAHHLLQQGNEDEAITWERFREEFYKKYFLNSARQAKELELLQLKQGSMTVAAYTSKFEELCQFSRVYQGAPARYEE